MVTLNGLKSHELINTLYDNKLISCFGRDALNSRASRGEWDIIAYMLKNALNIEICLDARTLTWNAPHESSAVDKTECVNKCNSIW